MSCPGVAHTDPGESAGVSGRGQAEGTVEVAIVGAPAAAGAGKAMAPGAQDRAKAGVAAAAADAGPHHCVVSPQA